MTTRDAALRTTRPAVATGLRLGERLRQLRVGAGLTQSELAGERFSKEYVSQIERGKTRPTPRDDRLARGAARRRPRLPRQRRRDRRARPARGRARPRRDADRGATATRRPRPSTRRSSRRRARRACPSSRFGPSSAPAGRRCASARSAPALELLNEARSISEGSGFSDIERADVLFTLGVCRYQLNSIQTAIGLFNESLALAERSGLPSDSLRSNILSWRSRCWRRQRDYEAAREDIERALQLAEDADDPRTIGAAYFQASLVADREGHWVLARTYAEKARTAYEELVRPRSRRPAHEQPRRPQLPARQDGRGDRAAEAGVRHRPRDRPRGRRRAGDLVARADPPPHGQRRPGRRAGAPRAAAARRARGLPRRDRERAARARPLAARAGPARRGRGGVPRPPSRASTRSGRPAIAQPPGSPEAISPRGAATTGLQHTSTALRLKHFRTSGSSGKGGDDGDQGEVHLPAARRFDVCVCARALREDPRLVRRRKPAQLSAIRGGRRASVRGGLRVYRRPLQAPESGTSPLTEPARSITTWGISRVRAQAEEHAHDLGAVLRLDHLVAGEARPLGHRRVDEAGADRDRTHAVGVELLVQRAGERDHGGLRRAVGGEAGRRQRAGDRGEVDDPAARLAQQRDRGLRDEEESAQVDADLEVEVLGREVLDVAGDADPGRVDEDVEPAEPLAVRRDEPRAVLFARDVGGDRLRAELGGRASTFSARREASVRPNPSSRSMRAIASPMPDEPPVTSAARSTTSFSTRAARKVKRPRSRT